MTIYTIILFIVTIATTILQFILGYKASKVWSWAIPLSFSVNVLGKYNLANFNWKSFIIIFVVGNIWYWLCYRVGWYTYQKKLKDNLHK